MSAAGVTKTQTGAAADSETTSSQGEFEALEFAAP